MKSLIKKPVIDQLINFEQLTTHAVRPSSLVVDSIRLQREFITAATSENTRRAYRSAVRHFLAWGGRLPSDESIIVNYLLAFSDSLNPRTLSLKMTALSQWHRHQGFADPCATPHVRKVLLGISRSRGRPAEKAAALLLADMEKIVEAQLRDSSLKGLRDCALLQIGFFGGFRRSELVSLQIEYLTWQKEGLVIQLPRSKTDQTGKGISKAIPYG